jgi:hypothetical protein
MSFRDGVSHENDIHGTSEKVVFDPSSENEITPDGSIAAVAADWTPDEERRLVRKCANTPYPSYTIDT